MTHLNLTRGVGSPGKGACWMSSLHYFTRQDASWTDEAPMACVDPSIRILCIGLNDLCTDTEREVVIGPMLFDPVGTDDPKLYAPRARMSADLARTFADLAAEARDLSPESRVNGGGMAIRARLILTYADGIRRMIDLGSKPDNVPNTRSKEAVLEMLKDPVKAAKLEKASCPI
jgi:hypothetical protein